MGQIVSGYDTARRQEFVPLSFDEAEALALSMRSPAESHQKHSNTRHSDDSDENARPRDDAKDAKDKEGKAVITPTPDTSDGRKYSTARSFTGVGEAANTGGGKRDAAVDGEWMYNLDQLERERAMQNRARRISHSKRRQSQRTPSGAPMDQSRQHSGDRRKSSKQTPMSPGPLRRLSDSELQPASSVLGRPLPAGPAEQSPAAVAVQGA